jgi:hypothetical protein
LGLVTEEVRAAAPPVEGLRYAIEATTELKLLFVNLR